jgi:hypothetical protein
LAGALLEEINGLLGFDLRKGTMVDAIAAPTSERASAMSSTKKGNQSSHEGPCGCGYRACSTAAKVRE